MTTTSVREIVDLAAELIRRQAHRCGRHDQDFAGLQAALTSWCDSAGLDWSMFPSEPPAMLVEFGDPTATKEIWLLVHGDTVAFEGDDLCVPRVDGGKLYARGAADDLGPVAVALLTARTLRHVRGVRGRVVITFDEETLPGKARPRHSIDEVVDALPRPDFALALEATGLRFAKASLGATVFDVTVKGRAGHTARPESGINAIRWLAVLLLAADRIPCLEVNSELFPKGSSLEPIRIQGGDLKAENVIPPEVKVRFNLRHVPDVPLDVFLAELRAALEREIERYLEPPSGGIWTRFMRRVLTVHRLGTRSGPPRRYQGGAPEFTIEVAGGFPPFQVPVDHPLVATLAGILREFRSGEVLFTQEGTGDIALAGVAGGELGPPGGGLHGQDEWVDIDGLYVLCKVLVAFYEAVGAAAISEQL